MPKSQRFTVEEATPPVIVSALKHWLPDLSWSKVRKLLETRRVRVGAALCLDETRKLKAGQWVDVFEESLPRPPMASDVEVVYIDRAIVIVNKPARMTTLRHKRERQWLRSKKDLQPTLDEVIPDVIYGVDRKTRPPVLSVHRIDRDTSGLLIFARDDHTQEKLIQMFVAHDMVRRYRAIVLGRPMQQTVRCRLVRDRGDGLRGTAKHEKAGKESVTHIKPLESFRGRDGKEYSEIECELETGRTHQIRIHLAEMGHPVCGDVMYRGPVGVAPPEDTSGAPRLALHATCLGLTHPGNSEALHFERPWPIEMLRFKEKLNVDAKPTPAGAVPRPQVGGRGKA